MSARLLCPIFALFSSALIASRTGGQDATPTLSGSERRVVITVDDLPGAVAGSDTEKGRLSDLLTWNQAVLTILKKHHAPALGMVNEAKLQVLGERDARTSILQSWIDSGMDLGNHTYSHIPFSRVDLSRYEDEVSRGDVIGDELLSRTGRRERYFRHPALDRGTDPYTRIEFQQYLNRHGYRIAPVTVDNADYEFNDALESASGDVRTSSAIKEQYVTFSLQRVAYAEASSLKVFGHLVPQVLLIHDSKLNAELLDRLLTKLEGQGYRFITLDDALTDAAYQPSANGLTTLSTCYLCWANRLVAKGDDPTFSAAPKPPSFVVAASEALRSASSGSIKP